jgi:UDP-glucose 4-epimerase
MGQVMDVARGHVAAIRKLGNMQGHLTCNLGPKVVAKALGSMKALLLLLLEALLMLC